MTMSRRLSLQLCGLLLTLSAPTLFAQLTPVPQGAASAASDTPIAVPSPKHPAEMMPNAPKVTCHGNQLTIQADNSSLRSVLAAVHSCIGIEIELPETFTDSRAYLQLGPGPAREVLDALLSSTDLNYVIQSSNTVPSKVETVLLMARLKDSKDAKESAAAPGFAMTPARRMWTESRRNARPAQTTAEDSAAVQPEPTGQAAEGQEKATAAPLDPSAASATTPSSSNAAQPPQPSEKATAEISAAADTSAIAASAAPAPIADPSQDAPAKKVLEGKIGAMEQLFEQRKQMIANPPAATDPH